MEKIDTSINIDTIKEEFAKSKFRSKIGAFIFTAIVVGSAALVALKIATIAFTVIGVIAALLAVGCIYDVCTSEGKLRDMIMLANNVNNISGKSSDAE